MIGFYSKGPVAKSGTCFAVVVPPGGSATISSSVPFLSADACYVSVSLLRVEQSPKTALLTVIGYRSGHAALSISNTGVEGSEDLVLSIDSDLNLSDKPGNFSLQDVVSLHSVALSHMELAPMLDDYFQLADFVGTLPLLPRAGAGGVAAAELIQQRLLMGRDSGLGMRVVAQVEFDPIRFAELVDRLIQNGQVAPSTGREVIDTIRRHLFAGPISSMQWRQILQNVLAVGGAQGLSLYYALKQSLRVLPLVAATTGTGTSAGAASGTAGVAAAGCVTAGGVIAVIAIAVVGAYIINWIVMGEPLMPSDIHAALYNPNSDFSLWFAYFGESIDDTPIEIPYSVVVQGFRDFLRGLQSQPDCFLACVANNAGEKGISLCPEQQLGSTTGIRALQGEISDIMSECKQMWGVLTLPGGQCLFPPRPEVCFCS